MGDVVAELSLVGDRLVVVEDGPSSLLLSLIVIAFIPQTIPETVLSLTVLLAFHELPLVAAIGLSQLAYLAE